jgi:hypothetical protein
LSLYPPGRWVFSYKKTGIKELPSTICRLPSKKKGLLQKSFFLERAQSARTDFHLNFLAVHGQGFGLQIRLPHLFGVALGKADIMAVLFAFFIEIKSLHNQSIILQIQTDKINRKLYC